MDRIQSMSEYVAATEGIISKFKNRKVSQVQREFVKNLKKYSNLSALIEDARQSDVDDRFGKHRVGGIVEGFNVAIYIDRDAELTDVNARAIKTAFAAIGQAHKTLVDMIIEDSNSTNGKNGPWEWSESGEAYTPKKASDIASRIKLETMSFDVHNDGVTVSYWFDDDNLWYGHVIVLSDCNDPQSGRFVKTANTEYSIEG
jgi:hypothetical protein